MTATETSPPGPTSFRGLGLVVDRSKLAAARQRLQSEGVSAWARRNGFPAKAVFDVLSGTRSCIRGRSHDIAVALQLKDGPTC